MFFIFFHYSITTEATPTWPTLESSPLLQIQQAWLGACPHAHSSWESDNLSLKMLTEAKLPGLVLRRLQVSMIAMCSGGPSYTL
jgi:hypothetical protein